LTIHGAEDAAVVAGSFSGAVAVDGSPLASGSLSISDVDSNDNPVGFADVASVSGDHGYGSFSLAAGTWSYQLNTADPAVQALRSGQTVTDTYTFVASDGSTQQISVVIVGPESEAEEIPPETPGPLPTTPPEVPPETAPEEVAETPEEQEEQPSPVTDPPASAADDEDPVAIPLEPVQPTPVTPELVLSVLERRDSPHDAAAAPADADSHAFLQELRELWRMQQAIELPASVEDSNDGAFWDELARAINDFDQDAEKQTENERISAEAAAGISLSLTAGFVSWALRAGSMAASFLAAMPTWRHFDPMPVLSAKQEKDKASVDDQDNDFPNEDEDAQEDRKVDAMFDR
ncbi:MAG: VCBS domain-containing protein, partial [Gammaproteobacteria bacterium]|nr:VCBS domain-containing protein [Gammaproteobacteria bacterium]